MGTMNSKRWVAAFLIGATLFLPICEGVGSPDDPPPVTLSGYQAIRLGMTYAEVVRLLGHLGIEAGSSGRVVTYTWPNAQGGVIVVTFVHDQVRAKAQGGLRP
jgi:hypothetical protein